jgi:hypothetical protein
MFRFTNRLPFGATLQRRKEGLAEVSIVMSTSPSYFLSNFPLPLPVYMYQSANFLLSDSADADFDFNNVYDFLLAVCIGAPFQLVYALETTNFETGEEQLADTSHWEKVYTKLALTNTQVDYFQVRSSSDNHPEGGQSPPTR